MMKNRIRWSVVCLLFLLTFLLSGCNSSQTGWSAEKTTVFTDPEQISTEEKNRPQTFSEKNGPASTKTYEKETTKPPETEKEEETWTDEKQTTETEKTVLPEDGVYFSKEDVSEYLFLYGHLPSNFITKKEAEKLGWKGGPLEPFAPGMCIGGSRFGNYEGLLPEKNGRIYTECDIVAPGSDTRGAKRIVFSNDGLIYYTEDHYKSFELLYGKEE